jgi:hypothetical protein
MYSLFIRLHPLERLAVGLWALLLLGVAGRVAVSPVHSQTVLPIYLNAAQRWALALDVYVVQHPMDVFRNPPGVAAAFIPLKWFPERVAGLIWRGLGAAVFLMGLTKWVRHGLPRPLTAGERGALFSLAVLPSLPSLNNGQVNLLIAGLLLLGAAAAARARGIVAGLWVALAAALKVYPIAAAMLLAIPNARRLLLAFALAGAGLAIAPFLTGRTDYVVAEYQSFLQSVHENDRTGADRSRWPRDAFLLVRVWAGQPAPEIYLGIQLGVAVGMAGLVFAVARRTRDPRRSVPLALNLGCVWMTVFGPATEAHTYTILGPTAAAVVVFAVAERRGPFGRARLGLACAGYAILVSPILREMFPNGTPYQLLGPHPVGGLLILAAVVWSGLRDALAPRTTVPHVWSAAIPADRISGSLDAHDPDSVRVA